MLSLKDQVKNGKIEIENIKARPTLSSSSSLGIDDQIHSSNSPSSSMTIEYHQSNVVMDPQLFKNDQFRIGGGCLDGMLYGPNNDYVSSMDWMNNLYDL